MNKIGCDVNLFSRIVKSRKIFETFVKHGKIETPWFDVGAGNNELRERIEDRYGIKAFSSPIDLDIAVFHFGGIRFKTVTSFEVLEHLYNPLFHLEQVHGILSEGGTLYLTTPNNYSLICKAEHFLSKKYRPHFHQFCERDLRDILGRAGFEIIQCKKFFRSRTGTVARISRNGLFVEAQKDG